MHIANLKTFDRSTTYKLYQLEEILSFIIPGHILSKFYKFGCIRFNTIFNKIKKTNIKKFNNLILRNNKNNPNVPTDNPSWYKNLSNIELPQQVKKVLMLKKNVKDRNLATRFLNC